MTTSNTKYVLKKGRATRMMKILQVRGFSPLGGDITLHVMRALIPVGGKSHLNYSEIPSWLQRSLRPPEGRVQRRQHVQQHQGEPGPPAGVHLCPGQLPGHHHRHLRPLRLLGILPGRRGDLLLHGRHRPGLSLQRQQARILRAHSH